MCRFCKIYKVRENFFQIVYEVQELNKKKKEHQVPCVNTNFGLFGFFMLL